MDERPAVRVSDGERQAAVDRLLAAHDEGRLDLFEYDSRLAAAYGAVTYAELNRLFDDLPVPVRPAEVVARRPRPARQPASSRGRAALARTPTPLKVLGTIWLALASLNVMVWALVSAGSGDLVYFWPMWLLVPGAALAAVTVGVTATRGPVSREEPERPAR